jgi:hypothetical protein
MCIMTIHIIHINKNNDKALWNSDEKYIYQFGNKMMSEH